METYLDGQSSCCGVIWLPRFRNLRDGKFKWLSRGTQSICMYISLNTLFISLIECLSTLGSKKKKPGLLARDSHEKNVRILLRDLTHPRHHSMALEPAQFSAMYHYSYPLNLKDWIPRHAARIRSFGLH